MLFSMRMRPVKSSALAARPAGAATTAEIGRGARGLGGRRNTEGPDASAQPTHCPAHGPVTMRATTPMLLTVDEVRQMLLAEIKKSASQSEWARRKGVNRSSVSLFLSGNGTLQPNILRALKLKKMTAYVRS